MFLTNVSSHIQLAQKEKVTRSEDRIEVEMNGEVRRSEQRREERRAQEMREMRR